MVRLYETKDWNGEYIENGVMHIHYDHGHMSINLAWFFPCGRSVWNKLNKTMKLDWNNYEKMILDLECWFNETIKHADFYQKAYCNKWNEHHQKACDLKRLIDEGKLSNGVPLGKEDIKKLTGEYKKASNAEKSDLKAARDFKKLKERLEQQVERDIKPCKLDM